MKIVKTIKSIIDVSFIIPAYNEEKYLPVALKSIKDQQTDLIGEIILIDDFSTDRTVEMAKPYGARIYKSREKGDVSRMRNDGLEKAKGKCVLYVDADCAFSKNYVETMARPIVLGEIDTSLCLRHLPLETQYHLFPQIHSSFYRILLQRLPKIFWLKIPIRLFVWLGKWLKEMKEHKKFVSLWSIPDRVHTSGILTRTEIARKAGGWKIPFGINDDTAYCLDIFNHSKATRWHLLPFLYLSKRREFPPNNLAFFGKMIRAWLKHFGIDIRSKIEKRNQKGYQNPDGVR